METTKKTNEIITVITDILDSWKDGYTIYEDTSSYLAAVELVEKLQKDLDNKTK